MPKWQVSEDGDVSMISSGKRGTNRPGRYGSSDTNRSAGSGRGTSKEHVERVEILVKIRILRVKYPEVRDEAVGAWEAVRNGASKPDEILQDLMLLADPCSVCTKKVCICKPSKFAFVVAGSTIFSLQATVS